MSDPDGESRRPDAGPGESRQLRLVIEDDLDRNRLTVFFRLILAIPLYIWLLLWSIAAFLAVILDWLCALVLGRAPESLRGFLAAYVRFGTHVYAYVYLTAPGYPSFDGSDSFAIDVVVPPPGPLARWKVFFRIPLAIPALAVLAGLEGSQYAFSQSGSHSSGSRTSISISGVLVAAAVLGWLVSLGLGRMPRGLRDTGAWAIGYGAQVWGYLLLLTDRYPNSDPLAALGEGAALDDGPVRMSVEDDLRRSRLTVFFRLPLAIPHLIWLFLWGILVFFASILNWAWTLLAGRSPDWLHGFLAAYVRYEAHVFAFLRITSNQFPGFTGAAGSYPQFEIEVAPPERQSRWKTLVRLILAIPALWLSSAYSSLATILAVLAWFSSLVTGRMPLGLRNAGAFVLGFQARLQGYLLMLTDTYPYSGPVRPALAGGLEGGPGPAPALAGPASTPESRTGLEGPAGAPEPERPS